MRLTARDRSQENGVAVEEGEEVGSSVSDLPRADEEAQHCAYELASPRKVLTKPKSWLLRSLPDVDVSWKKSREIVAKCNRIARHVYRLLST